MPKPKLTQRMEVRCCCDAHLIGWAQVPADVCAGTVLVFNELRFEVASVGVPTGLAPHYDDVHLALRSNDYPIEEVRDIPGFEEATEAERDRDEHAAREHMDRASKNLARILRDA